MGVVEDDKTDKIRTERQNGARVKHPPVLIVDYCQTLGNKLAPMVIESRARLTLPACPWS